MTFNLGEIESKLLKLIQQHGTQTMLLYLNDFDKNIEKNDYLYFKTLVDIVVTHFSINESDLFNSSVKTEDIADSRRVIAYLLQIKTNLKRKTISKFMNCTERSINKYKNEFLDRVNSSEEFYTSFKEKYNIIQEKLNQTQYGEI